jgi:S2P endopeptidase
LAAATEGVRIERMGVRLSCCLPVAYVQLDEQALALLPPTKQLVVFAAGVWHNVVLVAACALLLQTLPLWLSPLFLTNQGAWLWVCVGGWVGG